jgi:drug/metabolite transporter (DMT)-like permease
MAERTEDIRRRWAYFLLLTAPAMFAGNQVLARGLEGAIPPNALAFWRWAVATLVMLAITWRDLVRLRAVVREELPTLALLGFLGMVVAGPPVYIAGVTTSATNMALIYAASPIFIVAVSALRFGEGLNAATVTGIALALAGLAVVVAKGDPHALSALHFVPGDLWATSSMLGWSVYVLILQHRPSRLPMMARFAAIAFCGTLMLAVLATGEAVLVGAPPFEMRTVGAALFLGLVPSVMAFQSYGFAQRVLGTGPASLGMYLGPIYVALLAFLTIAEPIRFYHLIGGALILLGLWRAVGAPRRPQPEKT